MSLSREFEIRGYVAFLVDVMEKCRNLLTHWRVQEADLRDGLALLKFAYADAKLGLVGVEREDWQCLRASTIVLVAQLLKPLRAFNPDLTT